MLPGAERHRMSRFMMDPSEFPSEWDLNGWVQRLTGVDEMSKDFRPGFMEDRNHVHHITVDGGSSYHPCGTFDTPSLLYLRQQTSAYPAYGKQMQVYHRAIGDVMEEQYKNRGAVFQVASQWNCLEMVNPDVTPDQGVSIYETDRTQGPACAIGCGFSTLYRNYGVRSFDWQTGTYSFGQKKDRQLNLLHEFDKHVFEQLRDKKPTWLMQNGYMLTDRDKMGRFAETFDHKPELLDQIASLIRVGYATECPVTFRERDGHPIIPIARPTVTQVFCSAFPLSYVHVYGVNQDTAGVEMLSRCLLVSMYEATLRCAALSAEKTGNRDVFLTLLGGGAFRLPAQWIGESILQAVERCQHLPLRVFLCHYRFINHKYDFMRWPVYNA